MSLSPIPLWVRLKDEEPAFIKMEGEWMLVGKAEDLPVGQPAMVTKRTTGDEIEVHILEHVMYRRVRHRGDTDLTYYVIARFR